MKPQKHSRRQPRSAGAKNPPPPAPASSLSPRRRWLFRLIAVLIVPLFVIGVFELCLRLSGYGYPTGFFLKSKIAGHNYYVSNDRFGYRFFPPALARTPLAFRMAIPKPPHTFRIFVFGESAAMGDPDPSFGAWRYLQALLRDRFPGTDFEVVCVAMTAIDSHAILPIARECARCDGDLWIVYMGNNEMVGPYGAGTVFGSRAPGIGWVRASLALKTTKIGQLLDALRQQGAGHSATPQTWSGLNMFKDHQLRFDDPGRLRAYDNFRINLRDILRAGQAAGVPVILSTVGSNLKDCAPFASLHRAGLANDQKTAWDDDYQQGITLQTNGNVADALACYTRAAVIDPQYAELHFRAGQCLLALTNPAQARLEFQLARDDDALAFRADTRINDLIRNAATNAGPGVYLLDAARAFAENSPAGIPGNELFYEHVHLNFLGNYTLGLAYAGQVASLLPPSLLAHAKNQWASADLCDRWLAVSPWDRYRVWQENYSRVSEPPFTDQMNDVPRAKFYMATLQSLNAQMTETSRQDSRAAYLAALQQSPDDVFLLENFAQFLDQTGERDEAIRQEQKVCALLPQNPSAFYKVGTLYARQGKTGEAADYFTKAVAIRPDYVPALNDFGLIQANRRNTDDAARLFNRALRINPGYVETYLDWGFMEQSSGNLDAALAHYQTAANLQPQGPAAYFFQAVTFAAQQRRDDAIACFHNAVWMNPKFWQARYLLGGELAAEGKLPEAQEQFAAAASLRPDFERAHLNDGVALAKLGKLDDALKEFQAALALSPTNTVAQINIAAIQMNLNALKWHNQ